MNLSSEILSDITVFSKYAKFLPSYHRRETWEEIIMRNCDMHITKFPFLKDEIYKNYSFVLNKQTLPSMRSLQFAGPALELNNVRMYNCSAMPISTVEAFSEMMFLLLSGSGVGYSVQKHHVAQLPPLIGPSNKHHKYLIGDSIIGWADAVKTLVKAYFYGKAMPVFDYRDIRSKGSLLVTSGGRAPGPEPLKDGLHNIQKILERALNDRGRGTQLKSIEAHDICCYIADCVLSGGIRRAACLALFSFDDIEMLECKFGNWWESNPQRARSNNSVALLRHKVKKKNYQFLWERIEASNSGEPGVYFTNDKEMLVNPCNEAALEPYQFCNLTTVNVSDIVDQKDFNDRVMAASFIGTLQASYTDFHYLRPIWKETTEKDALLGVSLTGIASNRLKEMNIEEASHYAAEENKRVAKLIGINPARRVTLIKPEGTSSLVLGTSSGIHPWHSEYYIRRLRFNKNESIYKYLKSVIPDLIEDDFFKPNTDGVLSIPIKAPDGAITRSQVDPISLLETMKVLHEKWIQPCHFGGDNSHNVSITVTIRSYEWKEVGEWLWKNRDCYNGVAVLPYDTGTYKQPPFEEITKDEYDRLCKYLKHIDLVNVVEEENVTDFKQISACAGGHCEVV